MNINEGVFTCSACKQYSCGFIMYQCSQKDCEFKIDAKSASFTDPFKHRAHKGPLYLRVEDNTKSYYLCCGCHEDSTSTVVATCTTCEDYYLDFKCLNLPPVVRFKYDIHPLYLYIDTEKQLLEKRAYSSSWCDVCEEEIHEYLLFYVCFECTTLHVNCILGKYPYIKPGDNIKVKGGLKIQIASNSGASRPMCRLCLSHCRDKLVFKDEDLCFCSYRCIRYYHIFTCA